MRLFSNNVGEDSQSRKSWRCWRKKPGGSFFLTKMKPYHKKAGKNNTDHLFYTKPKKQITQTNLHIVKQSRRGEMLELETKLETAICYDQPRVNENRAKRDGRKSKVWEKEPEFNIY